MPKRLLFGLCLLLTLALGIGYAQQATPKPKATPKPLTKISSHVILIVVSGLGADLLNRMRTQMPTLQAALQANSFSAAAVEGVYPSLAQSAQATIASGMLPVDHGVFADESNEASLALPKVAPKEKQLFIWESATHNGLSVAALGYALTRGATIPFNQPEAAEPTANAAKESKHDPLAEIIKRDEQRTARACEWIETARPNLLLLTLNAVAVAQERFGPSSKEVTAAIHNLDGWLGQILTATEHAKTNAETTFLLVSDRGMSRVESTFNPNVVLAKKGWLTVDPQGNITEWKALAQPLGGAAAIYVKNPNEEKTVEAIFQELHEKPDSPVWRIVKRQELSRLGANPQAALFLEAAPSYVMGAAVTGGMISKANVRAASGYLPQRVELRPVLIGFGKGVKADAKLEYARLSDVAPTIARLLGFTQPASRGRVLAELLQP